MKISVFVEWQVRSDAITTAKNILAETYAGTRQFEGCHRYEIYEEQESPDRIFLLTQWDSRSHTSIKLQEGNPQLGENSSSSTVQN